MDKKTELVGLLERGILVIAEHTATVERHAAQIQEIAGTPAADGGTKA